ncbi:Z-ring formation inhibitor MciZ [Neobacillus piezotolerans]|uniref:Z-ring formation inhibitor MciZ n=1 Tax=Neobacillus piezotolerans TaxID=2259171 RepID=A0A3D8GKL5_9BACI|nr:Z-ring formation inhibitor MciZ [Neobacillus piezotolerans]RDU34990.1 Z-ring formation inhibitor MciZ [Neobacillus piezotolerans]
MKAYIHAKGFVLTGKASEIRYILKECSTLYMTVAELVKSEAERRSGLR